MSNSSWGRHEYLIYSVLQELRELDGDDRPVPKTELHKLCYLTDKKLQSEDVDLKLPTYWYQFGGVLALEIIETGMFEEKQREYEEYTGKDIQALSGVSADDFEVEESTRSNIEEAVSSIVTQFEDEIGVASVQDEQYLSYAPDDFILNFHKFRTDIQDIDENGSEFATDEALNQHLNDLLSEYSESNYDRMAAEFFEWEHLTRQLVKLGRYEDIQRFARQFWSVFSDIELRIKYNHNVPDWLVNKWRNEVLETKEEFERELTRYRNVVKSNRERTNHLEGVAEEYSHSVWELYNEG